jgi:hypothetical protein
VLSRYLKPELLIIDDMGMKHLPKRSGEYFFEIIMRRYETRSTMMTSNRPLEDWGKLVGDSPSATAILDRFLHHAKIQTIAARSHRLRHQTRSTKEPATAKSEKPTEKEPVPSRLVQRQLADPRGNDDDDHSNHWPVLKRQWVAGFEAPGDTFDGPRTCSILM